MNPEEKLAFVDGAHGLRALRLGATPGHPACDLSCYSAPGTAVCLVESLVRTDAAGVHSRRTVRSTSDTCTSGAT